MPQSRPRLTPAIADVRRAVRESLATLPDGLARARRPLRRPGLARARRGDRLRGPASRTARGRGHRRPRSAGGSLDAAERAARQATDLGLDPVLIVTRTSAGGRRPRGRRAHGSLRACSIEAMQEVDAARILLGHTLDDQAETVLLGLARGSGAHEPARACAPEWARTAGRCSASAGPRPCRPARTPGSSPGSTPTNDDGRFARVRVRRTVLPIMEEELGPGIAEALVRTARAAAGGLRRARPLRRGDRRGSRRALRGGHLAAGRRARGEPAGAAAAAHPARGAQRVPRVAQSRRTRSRSRGSSPTGTASRASTCPALGWSGRGRC